MATPIHTVHATTLAGCQYIQHYLDWRNPAIFNLLFQGSTAGREKGMQGIDGHSEIEKSWLSAWTLDVRDAIIHHPGGS